MILYLNWLCPWPLSRCFLCLLLEQIEVRAVPWSTNQQISSPLLHFLTFLCVPHTRNAEMNLLFKGFLLDLNPYPVIPEWLRRVCTIVSLSALPFCFAYRCFVGLSYKLMHPFAAVLPWQSDSPWAEGSDHAAVAPPPEQREVSSPALTLPTALRQSRCLLAKSHSHNPCSLH